MYTSDRSGVRARPRDAYGDDVATALRTAARTDLAAIIRTQRQALTEADWTTKFGRVHDRIADQILPRFSDAEIEEARQAAATDPKLIYLPPEAGAP